MSVTVPYGVNILTGRVEHIDEASKKNTYRCQECEQRIRPVQGEAQLKENHFRHQKGSTCTGKYDKALHDYAVQLLLENKSILIAADRRINYHSAQKEQWIATHRSDVKAISGTTDIHFEVVVTHDLDTKKLNEYAAHQVNCVRIDLTDPLLRKASKEEMKFAVLEDPTNKKLLHWAVSTPVPPPTPWWKNMVAVFVIGIVAVVASTIWKQSTGKKRNRRFRK